jgi:AcrR family transcriptional regulator
MPDARDSLLQAFVGALMACPYDKITVADVLTRAGVGRTTFYAHFRSKDELLAHSVDGLRTWLEEAAQARGGPLAFLFPYLEHVDSHRAIYQSFVGRESAEALQHHQRRMLIRLLNAEATRGRLPKRAQVDDAVPGLWQEMAAGAILAVVLAWMERRISASPEALFEELSRRLQQALGAP